MARKSKSFSELLRQKQHEEQIGDRSLKRLQQKVKQAGDSMASQEMLFNPKGVAKMSEVLEQFVETYHETTQDFADLDTLFKISILAWNLALLPKENRPQAMDNILTEMASGANQKVRQELKSMLDELTVRKDRFFSECNRFITNFDLQDLGEGDYQLSVASTLQA